MDKVLIVYGSINSVPSPEGAAPAKVIVDTVKHLDNEKFQVLSHFNKNLQPLDFDSELFKHIRPTFTDRILLLNLKMRNNYTKRKQRFITAQDSQLLYFIAVSRFVKRKRFKKVIVHVSPGLVNMVRLFNPNCNIVFFHHGTSLHTKLSETQWQSLLKNTVAIFGVNQAAADLANAHFKTKLPANRYFKIANGVDRLEIADTGETTSDVFQIMFSGRICKEKGILELLKAFKILIDKNYKVSLTIAGPAGINRGRNNAEQYLEICKKYIQDNNLAVTFTGNIAKFELFKLYKMINVLLLPTDPKLSLEGMPLSLLEAMAMGKPLIATNVGGNAEVIIDGHNGYLIYETENYEKEIANKIELLYLDNKLQNEMTINANEMYKANFTTEKMSKHFENALKQIGFI